MKPNGTITYVPKDNVWEIETTPDVVLRLKRIFPRAQQGRVTMLRLTHTDEIADELEWVLARFPMVVSDIKRLKKAAKQNRHVLAQAEQLEIAPSTRVFPLALPLRDYQAVATNLHLLMKCLLNADYIGLGKTAAAIGSFTDPRTLPALVVVQAHLPQQWKEEIEKFMPEARVHIIKQCQIYDLPRAEIYIISYSKLADWAEILSTRIKSLVFDEIQELRGTGTQKYKAAILLRDVVEFRLGLSATPIHNYGGEIHAVFNVLKPDALGTEQEFENEWCEKENGKLIVRDTEALGHYLRNRHLMIRRNRREVGRELPPYIRFVQEIDIDQKAYAEALGTNSAEELAKLILQGTFLQRGQAAREFDSLLRQATGVAKAPFVAEMVRMLLESGETVLVGAWHHAVFDILRQKLADFNPVMFTGQQTAKQKRESKEAFLAGSSRLMLMSLRSGAGTNGLQNVCSTVVAAELDWTPQVHEQLYGRLRRDGQTESVQIFIPVAAQGSDPTVAAVLGLKTAQSSGIIDLGNDEDLGEVEVTTDRVKQLAIHFLKSRGVKIPAGADEQQFELTA